MEIRNWIEGRRYQSSLKCVQICSFWAFPSICLNWQHLISNKEITRPKEGASSWYCIAKVSFFLAEYVFSSVSFHREDSLKETKAIIYQNLLVWSWFLLWKNKHVSSVLAWGLPARTFVIVWYISFPSLLGIDLKAKNRAAFSSWFRAMVGSQPFLVCRRLPNIHFFRDPTWCFGWTMWRVGPHMGGNRT